MDAPEAQAIAGRVIVGALRAEASGAWEEAERWARPVAAGGLGLGGVCVFGGEARAVQRGLGRLRRAAGAPFVAFSDVERGVGQQLHGLSRLPDAMAIAATGSEDLAVEAGALTAREALGVGIEGLFAPVCDLNTLPENPIINTRAFGDHPHEAARMAAAWISGALAEGAAPCAKHYPGHGHCALDSHTALATVPLDLETLERRELVPFAAAIEAGVPTVMTAHLAFPALTGVVADPPLAVTLSQAAISYLREVLGFTGLVVSDALLMEAIQVGITEGEAGVRAAAAGCDVLLCPGDPDGVVEAVAAALAAGRLSASSLQASGARLAALAVAPAPGEALPPVPDPKAADLAREIARRALTAVRGAEVLSLSGTCGARVVVASGDGDELLPAFCRPLVEAGVGILPVTTGSPDARLAEVLAAAAAAQGSGAPLGICLASRPRMAKETVGMGAGLSAFLVELCRRVRPAFALSLGAPYLLDVVPQAQVQVVAFSQEPPSQQAAAELLLRGGRPSGRLPLDWSPRSVG